MSAVIVGTGHDLPEWVLTNDELEAMGVGYDRTRSGKSLDQWVRERAGIRSRHRVRPGEGTSDIGTRAAQRALGDAGLDASDLGLIVMATSSSDYRTPPSAALVQANLGARCKFFQLDAGCTGFVDANIMASALMDVMAVEYALVISCDVLSQFCAPDDFISHCVYGDGGGAAILRHVPDSPYGLRAHHAGSDGSKGKLVWVPGGGTKEPISETMVAHRRHYAVWDHKEVYSFAVRNMTEVSRVVAERAGWGLDEVTWFVPHQPGRNIIVDVARRLDQPLDRFIINIDHTANTSAGTIPIALDEANRAGTFKDGDKLILPAVGVGLAWGALAMVWYDYRPERDGRDRAGGKRPNPGG